jgi:hypothetical protein
MSLKSFVAGFACASVIGLAAFIAIGVNWAHSALISKISTETGFVTIAHQESGAEKLAKIVSINLATDYCSANSLGDYFFVRKDAQVNAVLSKANAYLTANNLSVECQS